MNKPFRNDVEALRRRITDLDPRNVDELYGLEPLYEPGRGTPPAEEHVGFRCPHCGERNDLLIDLRGGERRFVDGCQSCSRPMELSLELGRAGMLRALRVRRL